MGRGRGKGKKLTISNEEDPISREDEKVPKQKRRGRPQKLFKDDFDEEEIEEILEEDACGGDNVKNVVSSKEMKNLNTTKHGRKRKRNLQEKIEPIDEKSNVVVNGSNTDELTKCNGFRHNGSRRKSKPRRAAEAGVQCKQDYA